jgi:hypothetical protein
MSLKYRSGVEVMKGDRVLYHEDLGEVEFVADPLVHDADTIWYVQKYGRGVMISEPKHYGSVFVSNPDGNDDLEFVSRGGTTIEPAVSQTKP